MKVLLTRPQGRNQSMEEALQQRDISYLTAPLLAVEAWQDPQGITALSNAEVLIFISTSAVEYALKQSALPPNKRYIAVGEATALALKAQGITPLTAPESLQQTEGLLQLAELQPSAIAGKHIVIIRGRGGREELAATLSRYGAHVSYWEVYQRTCPPYDAIETAQQWQRFGIDTILLTSGEVLTNLLNLLPKEYFPWLQACHIIVPSIRVEHQAKAAGLPRVTNATAANSQAMLRALGL